MNTISKLSERPKARESGQGDKERGGEKMREEERKGKRWKGKEKK